MLSASVFIYVQVSSDEAIEMTKLLALKEGLLVRSPLSPQIVCLPLHLWCVFLLCRHGYTSFGIYSGGYIFRGCSCSCSKSGKKTRKCRETYCGKLEYLFSKLITLFLLCLLKTFEHWNYNSLLWFSMQIIFASSGERYLSTVLFDSIREEVENMTFE